MAPLGAGLKPKIEEYMGFLVWVLKNWLRPCCSLLWVAIQKASQQEAMACLDLGLKEHPKHPNGTPGIAVQTLNPHGVWLLRTWV
jgi:hypothetical protein